MLRKLYFALRINSSRKYLDDFVREAAASLPEGAMVLDAGAGICPYQHYFSHVKYETADFCQVDKRYGQIDYVCDLSDIPVEDSRYDVVLLTQVLEHLPEPRTILKEMRRILKPGGKLWCSAPLFCEEHETPYDFFRYTQFGFSHVLESARFKIERIQWLEGYLGTLSYQMEAAARSLPIRPKHYGSGLVGVAFAPIAICLKLVCLALSLAFARLDLRHKYVASGHCKNYLAIGVKKSEQ